MCGSAWALAMRASETGRERRWPLATWMDDWAAQIISTSLSETVLRPLTELKVGPWDVILVLKLSLVKMASKLALSSMSLSSMVAEANQLKLSTQTKSRLNSHIRLNSRWKRRSASLLPRRMTVFSS